VFVDVAVVVAVVFDGFVVGVVADVVAWRCVLGARGSKAGEGAGARGRANWF
jgi:hypothetical protein